MRFDTANQRTVRGSKPRITGHYEIRYRESQDSVSRLGGDDLQIMILLYSTTQGDHAGQIQVLGCGQNVAFEKGQNFILHDSLMLSASLGGNRNKITHRQILAYQFDALCIYIMLMANGRPDESSTLTDVSKSNNCVENV
ncbi:hypothetical protein RRG08_015911 [Elysia crispata]|uniref:Uncharacterized protein n=1 Tax=Elysia crispata TaxID=231223 RepID=A0AAE1E1F3_9GAST|nr:hypothetical protein RRG08_015911 [Elysia crispata]